MPAAGARWLMDTAAPGAEAEADSSCSLAAASEAAAAMGAAGGAGTHTTWCQQLALRGRPPRMVPS